MLYVDVSILRVGDLGVLFDWQKAGQKTEASG